ncbi:MAG: hypothetical protein ABI577_01385 [bacterium]
MRTLFLAGHSDSGARYLPEGVAPWPERTRQFLADQTGEPWALTEVRFAPIGAGAADYLLAKVEAASPDILLLPFTAYLCTVGTVAESVRARFGSRAAKLFERSESGFQARTREGKTRRTVNRRSRLAARKILGTRTLATVEQVGDIYEEVLHRLARLESLQVLAIEDARFSAEIQSREPKLHQRIDQLYARVLPVARSHHFAIANVEAALRAAPDRNIFHQPDGVHTTAAFHDIFFGVVKAGTEEILARQAR